MSIMGTPIHTTMSGVQHYICAASAQAVTDNRNHPTNEIPEEDKNHQEETNNDYQASLGKYNKSDPTPSHQHRLLRIYLASHNIFADDLANAVFFPPQAKTKIHRR